MRDDSDSSDYGSDFTPDEEVLLNQLLTRAVAEHATGATPTPSFTTPRDTPAPVIADTPVPTIEKDFTDINSLEPAVLAALVADIEDGIEVPSTPRHVKVLGREKPRSPWRQTGSQPPPWREVALARSGLAWRAASEGAGNRAIASGM